MGKEAVENLDAKVVDSVFTMYLPTAKYSRGKNNLHLNLWEGYTLGDPRQKGNCNMQQILTLIKHVQFQEAINKSLHVYENLAQSVYQKNNLASNGLSSFNAVECLLG